MRPGISRSHSFSETNLVSHITSAFLLILVISALVTAQTFRGTILGTVVTAGYTLPNLWELHPRIGKGWQLNTVVTMRSGNSFLFDDYNNTGEFFPRPDVVDDPYAGMSAPDRFINLSAFAVPCTLDPAGDGSAASCIPGTWHFGSLGRNALRGPNYHNVDFSTFKDTDITENEVVQEIFSWR